MVDLKSFRKANRITQSELADYLNIGQPFISQIEKGGRPMPPEYISKLLANKQWDTTMLTGEGEMLKTENVLPSVTRRGKVIRFWENIEATGGGIMSFDDTLDGNYSEMILPDFTDCTDAIRLVGDSMYPRYKSGQILVFKEWRESFVEFGQVYLIITRTGYRMVKYLQPAPDDGKLTCVSENREQYPPFPIEIESIYRLYLVKGTIEQNAY